MELFSLNGAWQVRQVGGDEWLPASVPGGVHTDLLAAGTIPDPFEGDNELAVQWVAEQDWEYRRTFEIDTALLAHDSVELVCDGLDTLAEVRLNGSVLGSTDNMFRQYRWDVRDLLRAGSNEMQIVFGSPVCYTAAKQAARALPEVNDPLPGGPYLRKVPSHYGWDWGPKLAAIGIWRNVRLEASTTARLDDVHLRQRHTEGTVTISATVQIRRWDDAPLVATLLLTAPDGSTQQASAALSEDSATLEIVVDDPQVWWPNGYGAQPLYTAEVTLGSGDTTLDTRSYGLGLRTVELRQEPDEWGRSFTFVINGQPIFAKGANWIPADSFPTRITPAQLDDLLESAAAAHHNMLRIWGGGYYEDEHLYDTCDRLGLLVWQDWMFACAVYPLPDLLATLRDEVRQNIRRLRHRACLALWCGNNEIETAWVDWGWGARPELDDLRAAYDEFFHHTLPEWVAADDPDTAYWPSSPSSGTPMENPNGTSQGDVHQWAVWHALEPFSHYRSTRARFVSEFGFQSLPHMDTVATYAQPQDWNMTSYIMEHHQKNAGGNGRIITYLTNHFRMPRDFSGLVYLSQLLQAEAMRVGVEYWRREPACSGALYWQLNDCWPVASWASIDYQRRWKAAHYASRRFFAPLLLSIEDNGDQMGVFLTNDTSDTWHGEVRWSLETLDGTVLQSDVLAVEAAPHATTAVAALDFAGQLDRAQRRRTVLVGELRQNGEVLHTALATFVPTKHLDLEDPNISVDMQQNGDQLAIQLRARGLARFVELSLYGADVRFSDNYFDLPAGRTVRVTCPLPEDWSQVHILQSLQVRSLADSF